MPDLDFAEHSAQCDNCHSPLQGQFCHKCGQEKRNILRNVFGLVGEFFGEFSNWDARLWRTLLPLWFKPGRLTQRYVSGQRVPYVPALRLYLFSSIIAFLVFAKLIPTDEIQFNNTDGQFGLQYTPAQQRPPGAAAVIDPLQVLKDEATGQPSPTDVIAPTAAEQTAKQTPDTLTAKAPVKLIELDGDQDMESRIEQLFDGKLARLKANPQLAVSKFFSLAPQMMFLLLPLFALLLKLLYIRRNRFYMEHLLLCLHSHSAILHMFIAFILLTYLAHLSSAVVWLQQGLSNVSLAVLWYMPIYLLFSQKVFYAQRWTNTVLKFSIFSLAYLIFLSVALMFVFALSLYWA
jgi:hypothetical protein